jgi:hypothetical protein
VVCNRPIVGKKKWSISGDDMTYHDASFASITKGIKLVAQSVAEVGIEDLTIYSKDQYEIRALNGENTVRREIHKKMVNEIWKWENKFNSVTYEEKRVYTDLMEQLKAYITES